MTNDLTATAGGPNALGRQSDSSQDTDIIDTIPREWQMSDKGKKAVCAALSERRSTFKLYAPLPIVCRGQKCAFQETCFLAKSKEAPEGERCPLEIAQAIDMFEAYCRELEVTDDQYVDLALIRDLVDIDIQISRADRILASDGTIIQYSAVGTTSDGKPLWRPDVHKALEAKERLLRHKREIMSMLHATRKDKADDERATMDPSKMAAALLARKHAIDKSQVIDVTPTALGGKDTDEENR